MPCGATGRVTVILERRLKAQFDAKIRADGTTKKEWLTTRVSSYVQGLEEIAAVQLSLALVDPLKQTSVSRPAKATLRRKAQIPSA
jgi:hypothetical protein